MKLKLISLLVIALWMVSLQAEAEPKSLLSKIPNQYDWVLRMDLTQSESATQAIIDLASKQIPKERGGVFNDMRAMYESFIEEGKKIGLSADSVPYCYVFGKHTDAHEALCLFETSIPEETLIRNFKNNSNYHLTEVMEGDHKIYTQSNIRLSEMFTKLARKISNDAHDMSKSAFTYIDGNTILSADKKESLMRYFSEIDAEPQTARFSREEFLAKNPVLWVGSRLNAKNARSSAVDEKSADKTGKPDPRNARKNPLEDKIENYNVVVFYNKEKNSLVDIEFIVETVDQANAVMISSSAQLGASMLTMQSGNQTLMDCFKITTNGNRVSGKLRLSEELIKSICGLSQPQGLTIKNEE